MQHGSSNIGQFTPNQNPFMLRLSESKFCASVLEIKHPKNVYHIQTNTPTHGHFLNSVKSVLNSGGVRKITFPPGAMKCFGYRKRREDFNSGERNQKIFKQVKWNNICHVFLNRMEPSTSRYGYSLQSYDRFYEYKFINGFMNTEL